MDPTLILSNLLNPPVLFFFLGMLACFAGSDLEIPQPIPKFLSIYLLLAIGFKGGVELNKSGLTFQVVSVLGAATVMSLLVPLWTFFATRKRLGVPNAAAVAATYGSVSAVTFIAASAFLSQLAIPSGGYMVAAMALMESPAIIIGVALARKLGKQDGSPVSWSHLLRDALANGSVVVLCGSLVIGAITGEQGSKALGPFTSDIFRGMLCIFLLDMGIISARRLGSIKQFGWFPPVFAMFVPLINAAAALVIAHFLGMSKGDALLFTVLCASASYIAVPAAVRLAIPDANPGLYVTMALAITFPFNVVVGLPIYMTLINRFWN
jgi:uncharacterized protein